ncbi:MAG: ABC transporter ATP-binding protein [Spirochaetales bacterium]|nr:MAG: ABC transporter ATP-binding protein [Spirochaetales bacterium]
MADIVQFKHVYFGYGDTPVLEDADFSIGRGDFVSIIGPNGGGKTTLARLMLGLLKPRSGAVSVFSESPASARERIGYVPQYAKFDELFPITVMDVVLMGRLKKLAGFYSREDKVKAMAALGETGMESFCKKPFSGLSGGQRQRVLIARALAGGPDLLLMDEPTSYMDSAAEIKLKDLLVQLHERITIVIITHDLGFVSKSINKIVCVNVSVKLHDSRRVTPEMISGLYGAPVEIVDHETNRCACAEEETNG